MRVAFSPRAGVPLVHVELCPDCGRAVMALLDRSAERDDSLVMVSIARKLDKCEACAPFAATIRSSGPWHQIA